MIPESNTFTNLPRPAIVAHRGSSTYAPENTIAAFELAVRQQANGIELDANLTKDGQIVVFHDTEVDRTTNSHGRVLSMTLKEIKTLDAGSYFDPAFSNEKIPTLEEVFEAFGRKIMINIEIKSNFSSRKKLPKKIAQLVVKHNLSQWVFFSSFNIIDLYAIKYFLPETPIALLALQGRPGKLSRSWLASLLKCQAIHPHYSDISKALIACMHKNYLRVHPYTINDPTDMRRLIELKVDGIITNDPLLARQVLIQSQTTEKRLSL
jgi:glycerophosphoryl diester phosphodiesterase